MKVKVHRSADRAAGKDWQQWLLAASDTLAVPGYSRLIDSPDVMAAVGGLADIVSNATIQLMRNTADGDVRVRNELSRFMDLHPYRLGSRKDLISWIVCTMCSASNGSAFVLPRTNGGLLADLLPMPGAVAVASGDGYIVSWEGRNYAASDVLHFKLRPNPARPWDGMGLTACLRDVTGNLRQAAATKKGFLSDKWKPSVIVKVDALADEFAGERGRKRLIDEYISGQDAGAPWVIPAELMEVQQVKPLSLNDLALSDSVTLDKREIASIVGVTPYMLGVGSYSDSDHNHMIKTRVMSIANIIAAELSKKLLISDDLYFKFSARRLYSYSIKELADVADQQYVRGIMSGNEVRDWLELSPVKGLDERVILENYIPAGMVGEQKKLIQGGSNDAK